MNDEERKLGSAKPRSFQRALHGDLNQASLLLTSSDIQCLSVLSQPSVMKMDEGVRW